MWNGAGGAGDIWWSVFYFYIIVSSDHLNQDEKSIKALVLLTDVTTDEWAFYLLPLDDDIISLELPEFFRDNFLVNSAVKQK